MSLSKDHIENKLLNIFSPLKGDISVENLTTLSGGASAETWLFDLQHSQGKDELILRTSAVESAFGSGLDKTTEAKVQSCAYEAGVPVAKVEYILNENDGMGFGYIMERHAGETIPRKILRDDRFTKARTNITKQCGHVLADIHKIDKTCLPSLKTQDPQGLISDLKKQYQSFGEPVPVFDLAIRWLLSRLPENREPQLVHGDFRNGNFIVDENGIKTVLDWELSHLGDPMEDLGWLCVNSWRFGEIDKPVGGFGQREELFTAYEKASGESVDPDIVKFWEVFGTLKWGVICLYQTFVHLSGDINSVERAAIGRRVSETEIDLLSIIDG